MSRGERMAARERSREKGREGERGRGNGVDWTGLEEENEAVVDVVVMVLGVGERGGGRGRRWLVGTRAVGGLAGLHWDGPDPDWIELGREGWMDQTETDGDGGRRGGQAGTGRAAAAGSGDRWLVVDCAG